MIYFEGVCLVDTTVILAQPRVSRLRAAAGYVDHRGKPGRIPDPAFSNAGFARAPLFFIVFYWPNDAKKRRISSRDLGAQNLFLLSIEIMAYYAVGSRLLSVTLPKIGLKSTEISTFFDFFAKIHTFNKTPPGPSECPP